MVVPTSLYKIPAQETPQTQKLRQFALILVPLKRTPQAANEMQGN